MNSIPGVPSHVITPADIALHLQVTSLTPPMTPPRLVRGAGHYHCPGAPRRPPRDQRTQRLIDNSNGIRRNLTNIMSIITDMDD